MKKLLYLFYFLLAMLFLNGVTDKVAQLPNKSRIVYFAHELRNPAPSEFIGMIQDRYDAAVYTNAFFVVPATMYVLNGTFAHSLDIRTRGKIRFKYQVFPRCYHMSYNPIGFMLYVSDRGRDEYYGGIVVTGITPEMINFKINPFGCNRQFSTPLPHWVNKIVHQTRIGTTSEIVVEYPEELQIFSDSYVAPYLYLQSGCDGVSSKNAGLVDKSNNKDFLDFPFSVSVNGRILCKTVAELYDDQFFEDFNDAIGHYDKMN